MGLHLYLVILNYTKNGIIRAMGVAMWPIEYMHGLAILCNVHIV